ncbi:FtsX-like permease family protein [Massilia sp. PAMC28688]|uniref:ABC transporter permease n=1 Tax=Massilia sp. PAMC28688 TaxID=2861283 RepID=UPI001C628E2C|nr:FtsX-like permease family protein [Massilia sp. PAMC28688]QYF94873.1 FtsX-like permease family protein [Massilia sp. PAMC28688]
MEIRPIISTLVRNKTGPMLVAIQIAISLAILSNALHIVNVRQAVAARPSGLVDESSLFQLQTRNIHEANHSVQLATQKQQTAILRAVPGVVSVARVNMIPLSRNGSTTTVAAGREDSALTADSGYYVSPDPLVQTWGLKLVEGRDFVPAERTEIDSTVEDESPKHVLVTRALAAKVWPDASSYVGKTLYFGRGDKATSAQVVGVVEHLQTQRAELGPSADQNVISPVRTTFEASFSLFTIRAEPGQRDRVMKEAEEALRKHSGFPVLIRMKSMDEVRSDRYRADTALSWMLITVSVLLLLITASGIVGMASLWVQQRRKQIGVRRALGARRVDIMRYFLTENVMITAGGVSAGLLGAIGLNQLLVSQLEMAKLPLPYLLGGSLLFFALGVLAVYGPAWRAASISPAMATRSA